MKLKSYVFVIGTSALLAVVYAFSPVAAGQEVATIPGPPKVVSLGVKAPGWNPPRLANGRPNLQGYWSSPATAGSIQIEKVTQEEFDKATGPELEAKAFGFYRVLRGQISDPPSGKIPYQAWALPKRLGYVQKHAEEDSWGHCRMPGIPRQMYVAGNRQVVQSNEHIVVLNMERGDRVIPFDGRPHVGKDIKLWNGDSVGHWEGDVLVIDTTNQNGKTWHSVPGDFTTDQLHVVERLEMVDNDTINYEAAITDPSLYTRPWKMAFPWKRIQPGDQGPGDYEFLEWARREGDWNPATASPNAGHDPDPVRR